MIYYLNYTGIFCTVFESQILKPIEIMQSKGFNIKLINFEKKDIIETEQFKSKIIETERKLNNKITTVEKRWYVEKFNISYYIKILSEEIRNHKNEQIIFHCRSQIGGYIGNIMKKEYPDYNIYVISDIRGNLIEEYRQDYMRRKIYYKLIFLYIKYRLTIMEKCCVNNSDYLFCVSYKLKEYLTSTYKIFRDNITIIPTCLEYNNFKMDYLSRKKIRSNLNIENKFVVVYCGGGQSWQHPDKVIENFIHIRENNENAFLLILTKDVDIFYKYLYLYKIENKDYSIMSINYNEVNKYLSSSDLALLIRDYDPVNSVASPTKFAEYISCNLPVILTNGIGDLDYIIEKYRIGITLNEFKDNNYKISKNFIRYDNFEEVINKYYNWDTMINKIINVYQKSI